MTYALRNSQSARHSVPLGHGRLASDTCANIPSLQIPAQGIGEPLDVPFLYSCHHAQTQPPSQNYLPSESFLPKGQYDYSYGSGLIADNYVTFQTGVGMAPHGYPVSPLGYAAEAAQGSTQGMPWKYTANGEDSYEGVWFDASLQGAHGFTPAPEGSQRTGSVIIGGELGYAL